VLDLLELWSNDKRFSHDFSIDNDNAVALMSETEGLLDRIKQLAMVPNSAAMIENIRASIVCTPGWS